MTIEKSLVDGKLTLKVNGRLDTNTSPDLLAALKCDGATSVEFDFANLEYISSAGLRVLMTAQRSVMEGNGKVTIARPNEMVRGVLDMTGLSSVFDIV